MANLVKQSDDLFTLFDDFFKSDWKDWGNKTVALGTKMPAVNVKENENSFDLEVAAPGLQKEDLKVSVENGMLTLSAEKEASSEEEKGKYTRKEFSFQSFKRTFRLPEKMVNLDKVEAKYENGILHIVVPKKEEIVSNGNKMIQIK